MINTIDIKTKLKVLIAYDIGEVLDLLLKCLRQQNEKINEAILLLSRYQDLNRELATEQVNWEASKAERNRLRLAILEFIDATDQLELDLHQAGQVLITENRFQEVIEKRTEKIIFRGMLDNEDQEILIEQLVFRWDDYFQVAESNHLYRKWQWAAAVDLLADKFQRPPIRWSGLSDEQFLQKLYQQSRELRQLPEVAHYSWEEQLPSTPAEAISQQKLVLAYVHETIEKLLAQED